jgi:hypothetical protein
MPHDRELRPESVILQALAFLDWQRRQQTPWREAWVRWSASKDFAPTDGRAIFRVVQAAVGASRRAA